MNLPTITVITPSYNCGPYIEDTISSILGQRYPRLEYFLMDACSEDGTADILNKYQHLSNVHIHIEPDDGQYSAIQKAAALSSGDILCWLNADDVYLPWTFQTVGRIFAEFPEVDWVIGMPGFINEAGESKMITNAVPAYPRDFIRNGWFKGHFGGYMQQESMFWRRSLWDRVGGLNTNYSLAADFDLWTRFAEHAELVAVATPLAAARARAQQRSRVLNGEYRKQVAQICEDYARPPYLWDKAARSGTIARCLCRLLIRKMAPLITYSAQNDKWELLRSSRGISKSTLSQLTLEYRAAHSCLSNNRA